MKRVLSILLLPALSACAAPSPPSPPGGAASPTAAPDPSPGAPPAAGSPAPPSAAPTQAPKIDATPKAEAPKAPAPSAAPEPAPLSGSPPAKTDASPVAAPSSSAAGQDWPMWGGTNERNQVNRAEKGIPEKWDIEKKENVRWIADLGSRSYGNTVIAGGRAYVGTNNERERNPKIKGDKGVVMCFRESDGEFLWQAVHDKLPAGRVNDWPEEGICSSPTVEGSRVYYVSNRCELICADVEGFLDGENDGPFTQEKYKDKIDGDFIWVLDMMEDLTVFPHNLATSCPLIVGDLIFVLTSNGVDESHIEIPAPDAPSFIAVNKQTGKVVWEDRSPDGKILHGQWSSPSYALMGGRPQVVYAAGDGWVRSFDPPTGKLLWMFDCNPKDSKYELGGRGTRNYIIATPVLADDHVYIAVGQDPEHGEGIGHLYSIDATKSGDVTESGRTWHFGHYGKRDFGRTMASVAVKDGLVYAADLSGFLHCLDQKTGALLWVHDTLAEIWGSPTVIDGKVFLGTQDGDVLVFREGRELKLLATNSMASAVSGTPVAAHGVLYVANRTKLFAIAGKK